MAVCVVAGWGGLTWLVTATSPQVPSARLAFVFTLAIGAYATAALLTYAACLLLWPAAPRLAIRTFSRRQGILWAGLLATLALLRLSGEMSALTVAVAFAAFATAEYTQLRLTG